METVEFTIGELAKPVEQISVLLVDDDEFIHEMMRLFLANTQYSLVSSSNTHDAIRVIDSDPPDIVITDAIMPGESGFALIERMKSRPASADIPVILWTIMEGHDGSVMDASGKADVLVNKPFYRCDMMEGLEKARLLIKSPVDPNDITFRID